MSDKKQETIMEKLTREINSGIHNVEKGLVEIDQSAPKPNADDILDMIRKRQGVINPDHD